MKIRPEHYSHLLQCIKNNVPEDKLLTHIDEVKQAGRYRDLETRIVSDVSRVAVGSNWICDNIYQYANDVHWLTASRKAFYEVFPNIALK